MNWRWLASKVGCHFKDTFSDSKAKSASRQFFFAAILTVCVVFAYDVIKYGHGVNASWASIWGSVFVALGGIWGYSKVVSKQGGTDGDGPKD